jgi:KEOPS complex subunit Cgi121
MLHWKCKLDRKFLNSPTRSLTMDEIRLLFGRPLIKDYKEFISAVRELQARSGHVIQVVDADRIVSERHLTFAAEKALLAFSEDRNVAKDLGVEILRYAAGEHQIERALSIGASTTTKRVALIMIQHGKLSALWPNASDLSKLIEVDGKGCSFSPAAVKDMFHISRDEIQAAGEAQIPDLVLERVALVDTMR